MTTTDPHASTPVPHLVLRGGIGGFFMGLANLVPGISGGTMLLAAGIYPQFIRGVAELSTFRFRLRSVVLVGAVVAVAFVSIAALAATLKGLVLDHRWVMYSIFIGLTLGGVPLILKRLRPVTPAAIVGALVGLAGMVGLAIIQMNSSGGSGGGDGNQLIMLLIAGIAGGAAMILPGVSGSYLLLILGQYVLILGAISATKDGVFDLDAAAVFDGLRIVAPFGIGVVVGVVGVSNVMKWLLDHAPQPTLGVLLGLLIGAVVGLWPFQQALTPVIGDVVKGVEITNETQVAEIDREDWPSSFFRPNAVQIGSALGLVLVGLGGSLVVGRLDRDDDN